MRSERLSFHLRSVFTPRFTMSNFYFPFATWQCHCWLYGSCPSVCENVARAACVISRLLAGGAFGFRIVPLLLLGLQITVWHFCVFVVSLLFSFTIPIPEVIQCYHLFWYFSDACELIS